RSTRFISPTKTPEYLAAGLPVISTAIKDVVRTYGKPGLVRICDGARSFIEHGDAIFQNANDQTWLQAVDSQLQLSSWDITWAGMAAHEVKVRKMKDQKQKLA
ncbi:MAG: glycosyltransferase family 1 protein, partial [Bacteroidota bacterium]|nr:glycosyltransferase family 1 protein [Bacteroidota bacterium]